MKKTIFLFSILIVLLIIVLLFRRDCKIIPKENLKEFSPSIEYRTSEKGLIYKIWQRKGDSWYQCKTNFERLGFN